MSDFAETYKPNAPFGTAEEQLNLEPVERGGFSFARMCKMYGGLEGSPVSFNSTDFEPEALEFGKKLLEDRGYTVTIGPAPRRRAGVQDTIARITWRKPAK